MTRRGRTFTLRVRGVTVGWSALERRDEAAGVARGAFRPGPGYDLVEPIFRLYADGAPKAGGQPEDADKLARYHAARDRLALTLHAPNGSVVPASAIHVLDRRAEGARDAIELEVTVADRDAWRAMVGDEE